jgi:hypothetical protein
LRVFLSLGGYLKSDLSRDDKKDFGKIETQPHHGPDPLNCAIKERRGTMAGQVLRDRRGRQIGTIKQLSNGKLEAHDATGRVMGTFDPKTNETRDSSGRLVGRGNRLSLLVTGLGR